MEIGIERTAGNDCCISNALKRMSTEVEKLYGAAVSAKNRFYKELEQLNEQFKNHSASAERENPERENQIMMLSQEISGVTSAMRELGAKYSGLKESSEYSSDAKKYMQYSMLREMAQSRKQLNSLEAQMAAAYLRK